MFQGMMSTCLALVLAAVASAQDIQSQLQQAAAASAQASHDAGYGQGGQNDGYGVAPQGGLVNSIPTAVGPTAAPTAAPTAVRAPQPQQPGLQFDPNAAQPITNPNQAMTAQGAPPQAPQFGNSQPQPQGGNAGVQPSTGGGQMVNPMQTLLGGLTNTLGNQGGGSFNQGGGGGGFQSAPLVSHGQVNSQVLSTDSQEVISGLIEAFMHKYQLAAGEKACLETNIGQLTGSVMGVIADVATAIKALIAGHGSIQADGQGPLISAGMDSAMKITGLVGSATSLAKGCVHGDALQMLKDTAHHMINGTYLQRRFLVNGVDIAHGLADAVVSFEAHDFHKFGADIGTTLRKILLSDANGATRLPEGIPDEVIIQKTTDGLMEGFFVRGSGMEITDTADSSVRIHVDLHQCMAGKTNEAFFKELWQAAWHIIAKLSAHGIGGGPMQNPFAGNGQGQPKWAGDLMIAMMQFPMVLSNCGMQANMQHMLMEAMQTIGDLKVHFVFPQDRIQAEDATNKMAKAVTAWTNWNFEQFGFELGKIFRELIMLAFPQKFSMDASGRIQAALEEPRSSLSPLMVIGGASISLFVVLSMVRTRRSLPKELPEHMVPMTDRGRRGPRAGRVRAGFLRLNLHACLSPAAGRGTRVISSIS